MIICENRSPVSGGVSTEKQSVFERSVAADPLSLHLRQASLHEEAEKLIPEGQSTIVDFDPFDRRYQH